MERNFKTIVAVAVVAVIAAFATSAFARQQQPQRRPLTQEERAAVVELAKKLQQNPLDTSAQPERERVMMMLIQSPDITVTICAGDETPWMKKKYKYASELAVVHLVSTAAYVISAGDKVDDKAANLAGIEGAIKAYQAIVAEDPKAKWRPMEELIVKQQSGELQKAASAFCTKKD